MTTWAQFRTDFKAAVQALVPTSQVVWRDMPRPMKKPNVAMVIMNMMTSKAISPKGEMRYSDNLIDPTQVDENLIDWKETVISFRVETHQQSDIGVAWNAADKIGMRLKSFNDQSSVNDVLPISSVKYYEDDRAVSVVVFDVKMNVLLTDTGDVGIGTFDHIELSSDLQVVEGTDLPVPPNYLNVTMPSQALPLGVGGDTLVSGTDVLLNA